LLGSPESGKVQFALITGDYTYIRGTEYDDVAALSELYRADVLRAGLLDGRREPVMPSQDDLQELLGRKEIAEGAFYTIEDREGSIQGFCSLKGVNPEARFCEFSLLFIDPATYHTPIATEATATMLERAFLRLGLRKVMAYCLSEEHDFASLLKQQRFESAGIQREVLYAKGRWHDVETFARTSTLASPAQNCSSTNAL